MRAWKTLRREMLIDHGKFLKLERHAVQLPDGRVIDDWDWVITPDFVNIFAVTEDGRCIVFRQTKYSVKGETLAPVGGYIEPGEAPLAAAQRELREESGYSASDWRALGTFPVDGNRGCGTAHFFLAGGARFTGRSPSDDLEEQELLLLSLDEVEAAMHDGRFKLLPWVAIMALGLAAIES